MDADNELKSDREQIAAGAGLAIAEWSIVEATLTFLFVSVLDQSSKPVAPGLTRWEDEEPGRRMHHTLMNAVIGFPARVDMVGAAMSETELGDGLRLLWPGIARRLLKKYKSRHEVAHFTILNVEQKDRTKRALLAPFATTVGSYSSKQYGRAQLDQKTATFQELRKALL